MDFWGEGCEIKMLCLRLRLGLRFSSVEELILNMVRFLVAEWWRGGVTCVGLELDCSWLETSGWLSEAG